MDLGGWIETVALASLYNGNGKIIGRWPFTQPGGPGPPPRGGWKSLVKLK